MRIIFSEQYVDSSTTSAPLTKLAAVLRKGSKSIKGTLAQARLVRHARGQAAQEEAQGRQRKLTVQGQDAQGRTATATAAVRLQLDGKVDTRPAGRPE